MSTMKYMSRKIDIRAILEESNYNLAFNVYFTPTFARFVLESKKNILKSQGFIEY